MRIYSRALSPCPRVISVKLQINVPKFETHDLCNAQIMVLIFIFGVRFKQITFLALYSLLPFLSFQRSNYQFLE